MTAHPARSAQQRRCDRDYRRALTDLTTTLARRTPLDSFAHALAARLPGAWSAGLGDRSRQGKPYTTRPWTCGTSPTRTGPRASPGGTGQRSCPARRGGC
jgi:hypothetical protein